MRCSTGCIYDKFGEPREVVYAIILDIKRLKPVSEGDNAGFLHMVDIIERCWLELNRLGLSRNGHNKNGD